MATVVAAQPLATVVGSSRPRRGRPKPCPLRVMIGHTGKSATWLCAASASATSAARGFRARRHVFGHSRVDMHGPREHRIGRPYSAARRTWCRHPARLLPASWSNAAGVDAGTANMLALNDCSPESFLREPVRKRWAGLARTNNNRVEFPGHGHLYNHTGIRVQRLVRYGAGYQHPRLILVA